MNGARWVAVSTWQKWMPIETAPTNVEILVCGSKRLEGPAVARRVPYDSGDEWLMDTCSSEETIYPPKFWMPLPDLPEELR